MAAKSAISFGLGMLALTACGGERLSPEGNANALVVNGVEVAPGEEVDAADIGLPIQAVDGMGLRVTYRGPANMIDGRADNGFHSDSASETEAVTPEDATTARTFLVVNAQTGQAFDVLLPEGMDLGSRGTPPSAVVSPEIEAEERLIEKTWSDGVDTRLRRAVADGWADNFQPYSWIGGMSSGCTGTKVGNRTILTAAHCVTGSNNSNKTGWQLASDASFYASTFYPRVDQNIISPTWGSQAAVWYWVPAGYVNGTCNSEGSCNKFDIAIALLDPPTTGNLPGYMGTWAVGNASFSTSSFNYMRGYPSCGASGDTLKSRPGGETQVSQTCAPWTLYGDSNNCDVGAGQSVDPATGRNREYLVGCDGSPGMSGSALYSNSIDSQAGTRATGVYSQYLCVGPACTSHWTNRVTVVTPEVVGIILSAHAAGW